MVGRESKACVFLRIRLRLCLWPQLVVKLVKGSSLSEQETVSLVPVARKNSSHSCQPGSSVSLLASRQLPVQRVQSFPCSLTRTPSVTVHRLGSSTWFDFSSPSCHTLPHFENILRKTIQQQPARRLQAKQTQAAAGSAPRATGHRDDALGHPPAGGPEA